MEPGVPGSVVLFPFSECGSFQQCLENPDFEAVCGSGSVAVLRLTGGVPRHLNDTLALFADLSGVEGPNPDGYFHRGSGHDERREELQLEEKRRPRSTCTERGRGRGQ